MLDGLTKGIANAEYHGGSELTRSTASSLLTTSPAKVKYARDNPLTYKGVPLIMGGCVHSMVLEPECLDVEYAIKPPDIDGKRPLTKHYKEEFAAMQ